MINTRIAEIEGRNAVSAWSPIKEFPDVIAIGVKDSGGAGFDESGGELEIYDMQLSSSSSARPQLLGSIKTESRFASLSWSPATLNGQYPHGLLAGGMETGRILIWDPRALMGGKGKEASVLVATFSDEPTSNAGPVQALQFNALIPTQLAAGGTAGKVTVFDLTQLPTGNPQTPSDSKQQLSPITAVAWNSQVAHILATSAADGTVHVWDLKARKLWCELRSQHAVADLAWNPTQGLHLLTASAEDKHPVIQLWDLRASTSMPLTTLTGHSQGLLQMAWCPHDDHLLLSCGKDNRTILWDLFTLRPVAEVPSDQYYEAKVENSTFGASGLASSQQRRYAVQWSTVKRGVASTCSLNQKVQAHSILGLASQAGRPPKWMQPAASVAFGFGGAVISCGSKDRFVRVRTVAEQPNLAFISNQFEATISSTPVSDYCQARASEATEPYEAQLWAFMRVIFETNARQQLLDTLGFDQDAISQAAANFVEEDWEGENGGREESKWMSAKTEEVVKNALLVGNFEAAVECCFRTENFADALILASCGGSEIWSKTQQRYFEEQATKKTFLSTVSAVIQHNLEELVQNSDPSNWHETLAILSTYGKSEEFSNLCIALGDLLEANEDFEGASLCYMCSLSLERAIRYWRGQLQQANENYNGFDIVAVHDFVVRVSVFLMAVGKDAILAAPDSAVFSKYAWKLAEQGLLIPAAKYCKGDDTMSKILRDRLYRSKASADCLAAMGGAAPDFPFAYLDIGPSRGPTIDRAREEASRSAEAASFETQRKQYEEKQQAAAHSGYSSQANVNAPTMVHGDLPVGWVEIQDPASGNYYYANQTTGEVTWDKPTVDVAPHATPPGAPEAVAHKPHSMASLSPQTPNTKKKLLADKYGDGFVTSSSHPELANQYGNLGTGNPYGTLRRPGIASVSSRDSTPVKTSEPDLIGQDGVTELRHEYIPIQECLTSLIKALNDLHLSAVDKRLMAEAEKAVLVMLRRLAMRRISEEIGQQLLTMCGYVNSYDFRTATAVLTSLVSSEWRDHKDWLKGTKSLLQLATKKFSQQ